MKQDDSQREYATGIEPVDFEHRRLMAAIDDTCTEFSRGATRDSVLDGLGLLYMRISAHVALEQKMVREHSPQHFRAYRENCQALLERIGVMMDAFYEGRCHVCDKALAECLRSWFEQHLKTGHEPLGAVGVRSTP